MRRILLAIVLSFGVYGLAKGLVTAGVGCAPTAEAAVARLVRPDGLAASSTGYRVVSIRTDRLRARRYALVASCHQPTRPLQLLELDGVPGDVPKISSVRVGDRVTVLGGSGDSRVQLAGVAQDAGAMNETVRVMLPKFSEDAVAAPVIRCRVTGAGVVEVLR